MALILLIANLALTAVVIWSHIATIKHNEFLVKMVNPGAYRKNTNTDIIKDKAITPIESEGEVLKVNKAVADFVAKP